MSKGLWQSTTYSIPIITPEGTQLNAAAVDKYASTNNAKKLNARVQTMDFLQIMSEVTKSSKDILILKNIIEEADATNEIRLLNITKFASIMEVGVTAVKGLLKRADNAGFLHKIDTGHYMMNPFVLLSKGLTSAGGDKQESVQLKWRSYTVVMTESDKEALVKLTKFLDLPVSLPASEFTISVANQFVAKGRLTEPQRNALLKHHT